MTARSLWMRVGMAEGWDAVRVRLDGEDIPADLALVELAVRIRDGETDMDTLRCIAGDVLEAMEDV